METPPVRSALPSIQLRHQLSCQEQQTSHILASWSGLESCFCHENRQNRLIRVDYFFFLGHFLELQEVLGVCSWQPAGLRVLAVVRCSRTVTFAHGWACACVPSQPSLTFPVCAGAFSGEPPATATTAGALTPTASRGPISGVAGRYGSESVHAVQCAAWLRVWLRDCCLGLICCHRRPATAMYAC